MSKADSRIAALCRRFNAPVIPPATVRRCLAQFDGEDRCDALCLLGNIECHSYSRLVREMRALHGKWKECFAAEGFDAERLDDIDFRREFTCKSVARIAFNKS